MIVCHVVRLIARPAPNPEPVDMGWLPDARPHTRGQTTRPEILLRAGVLLVQRTIERSLVLPGGAGEAAIAGKASDDADETRFL